MASQTLSFHARVESLTRCTPLRIGFFLCAALAAGVAVFDQAAGMNSFHDAQFLSAYERHARIAVTHFHQLPLWDPYTCGGMYGLAAPQTRYASPFFLLSWIMGVDSAAVVMFFLLPALGMEGMYRYARSWGALSAPAFLFAPLFPLSGWFAFAWHYGWVQFLSFCLVPWILEGLRGALRGDPFAAFRCAISVALTIGFGGTYTLPMALLICLCELFAATLPASRLLLRRGPRFYAARMRGRVGVIARGLIVTIPLVLGIGAFRFWPMLESIEATLRIMGGEPRFNSEQLRRLLFMPASAGPDAGHYYLAPAIALALFALPWRRNLLLWLGGACALALAYGHVSAHAPFVLLRRLPLYDTLRYPERYLLLFALAANVLAARGATTLLALARRTHQRWLYYVVLSLLTLAASHAVVVESKNARTLAANVHLLPTPRVREAPFRQSRGNRWLASHFVPEGMGTLNCGEAYPVPMSTRLRGDLPAEEYLLTIEGGPSVEGTARRVLWTPNRLLVSVDAPQAVRLAINQNYHPGWRANVGRVDSLDGLLTVVLPAGRHDVELSFRPRSGIGGLFASVIATLCGACLALRRPASRLKRGLSVAAGPIAVASILVVWPEAPWRRPAPRTETGEPVLFAELPSKARALHARFDVPLVLEGAYPLDQPLPPGTREFAIELFFRRTGPLSSSLGVFTQVIGPNGPVVLADHAVLSGSVYIAKMPEGVIVRDAFRLPLPNDLPPESQVLVGIWNAYSDGARHRVIEHGTANVTNDALVIGTLRVAAPP